MGRRRTAVVVLSALLVAGACSGLALATGPGRNGRIAFRRYFTDDQSWGAIFTMAASGGGEQRVTRPPRGTHDDQPDWSPDGKLLVFQRCPGQAACAIFTVHPDGSGLKQVSPHCPAGSIPPACEDDDIVSFTPDGKQLVFTRASGRIRPVTGGDQIQHSDIVETDLDGGNPRVLLGSRPYAADYLGAAFAPDGKRLVYERSNSPLGTPAGETALFVFTLADGSEHRITPWSLNAGDNPDWSPDGAWIVFHSNDNVDGSNGQFYLVHPDGTGLHLITHFHTDESVRSACFSPDGRSIVFAMRGKADRADIYVMHTDGSGLHPLTRTALWDSAADWGPAR
jgi:TolB protein